jgi:hypothetical protein
VTLVRPADRYVALSNMPVEKETGNAPSPGFTEVKVQIMDILGATLEE